MIRVLIVADIRLYQEGLAQILSGEPGLQVVGTAPDLGTAVQFASERAPEIALVDIAMPDSLTAVRHIAASAPAVKVVAVGMRDSEQDLVACAEAGIAGYVPRSASVVDLVAVLESVGRGELLCSPRTAAALLKRVAALAAGAGGASHTHGLLTPREREIGALLEAGLSNKDIAVRLGIEVATVKNHVHNLLEKLHVHRRAQAAARLRGSDLRLGRRATPVP